MSEDNVVRPAFGKQKIEEATVAPIRTRSSCDEISDDYKHIEPLTGEALLRAQKDLVYLYSNRDFVSKMRDKLEEAGDVIFSLHDYVPDKESIRIRRQGLQSFSLEDLCNEANKTNQLQWRTQPSYLGALTLEHHARVQAALSIMPSEEELEDRRK